MQIIEFDGHVYLVEKSMLVNKLRNTLDNSMDQSSVIVSPRIDITARYHLVQMIQAFVKLDILSVPFHLRNIVTFIVLTKCIVVDMREFLQGVMLYQVSLIDIDMLGMSVNNFIQDIVDTNMLVESVLLNCFILSLWSRLISKTTVVKPIEVIGCPNGLNH